ncbi:hypothetical protein SLA2020_526910 [Shorea laevis]
MEGRRLRRYRRGHAHTLLPLRSSPPPPNKTLLCCYYDFKIYVFNDPLFRFGRKHATFLRLWFSIGVGFSLTALLLATLILLWHLFSGSKTLGSLGIFPSLSGLRTISLADAGLFVFSTLLSVSVHEFGHAVAAASSDGIKLEYIAVFIALLFPGALVALDYDLLQALPRFTALRIYCAGVWHNAVFCAVCGLILFLLPFILFPVYVHAESPLVLDVASSSPLYGVLSSGDVIVSLDGIHIHDEQDWRDMTALLGGKMLTNLSNSDYSKNFEAFGGRKGYCSPHSLFEEGMKIMCSYNQSTCSNELVAFESIDCYNSSKPKDMAGHDGLQNKVGSKTCLNAKEVVKLDKCGDGWIKATTNGTTCMCSQDESCLSPVQLPGLIWVEITYSRPYSSECLQLRRSSYSNLNNSDIVEQNCVGTFVFIGDVTSMVHTVQLTAYWPRWNSAFGAYLPKFLERCLICTFHVSLTLALLNSLPVYFLDGESILEVTLCDFTSLSPRRRKVLQICLFGGTSISILAFLRIFFFNFY